MSERWIELREITADSYRCDLCGEQADTIHFVPWVTGTILIRPGEQEHDSDCKKCLFACPRHDPGGYHFELDVWLDPAQHDRMARHLDEKGGLALARLYEREDAMRHVPVDVHHG